MVHISNIFIPMRTLHDIGLTSSDLQAIQEAARILKELFPVVEIRLFGSKASGKDDSQSDIDLLVLTRERLSWRERNFMTDSLYDTQKKFSVILSLLVVSSHDWSTGLISSLPIHDAIEEEGIAA